MKLSILREAIIVIFCLVAVQPLSAFDFEQDGLFYDILSLQEKRVMVTNGDRPYSGDIVIPESVKYKGILEFNVDSIRDDIFRGNENITSVKIAQSVKLNIRDYSFRYCTNLISLEMPESVTSIGRYAFDGCTHLSQINVPEGVSYIGSYAFYGCSSLKTFKLPSELKVIGEDIFMNCTGLESITIPDNVTHIGPSAFYNCINLGEVTLPIALTNVGKSAFYNCSGLKRVNCSSLESMCYITYEDEYANPLYYAHHLYLDDEEVIEAALPEGVLNVGNYAFVNSALYAVTIPSTVREIGVSAFEGSTSLNNVAFPEGVEKIGASAFLNCNTLVRMTISGDVLAIGNNAFGNCNSLKSLILKDGDEPLTLGSNTLNGNESLFASCKLDSLYLGRNLKYDDVPFRDQTNLRNLVIGDRVTQLGDYAFRYCSGLVDVYVKCKTPVALTSNVFFSNIFTSATVHISGGTEESYLFAEQWREFMKFDVISEWPEEFIQEEAPITPVRKQRMTIMDRIRQ